jgi:hypothetical protein
MPVVNDLRSEDDDRDKAEEGQEEEDGQEVADLQVLNLIGTWPQCYKTLYVRKLCIFIIS